MPLHLKVKSRQQALTCLLHTFAAEVQSDRKGGSDLKNKYPHLASHNNVEHHIQCRRTSPNVAVEYPFERFRWSRWKYRAKCYILGRRRRSQSNAKSSLAELQWCTSFSNFSLWMSFESISCPVVFGGKTCQRGDSFGGYARRQSWQATAMASQSGAGNLWDVHRSRNEGTKGRQASDVRWSDFMAMAGMDQHGSALKALRTWEYVSADEFLTHWHNFHPSPDSAHGWGGVALLMLSQKHAKCANWPESIG